MDALLAAFALEAKEVASVKFEENTRPSPRSCACLVSCILKVIGNANIYRTGGTTETLAFSRPLQTTRVAVVGAVSYAICRDLHNLYRLEGYNDRCL